MKITGILMVLFFGTAGIVCSLLAIYMIVFGLIIVPIFSLINCIKSSSLSTSKRILWLVSMLLFWGVAPLVYAYFFSGNAKARKWARNTGLILILFLISAPFVDLNRKQRLEEEFRRLNEKLTHVQLIDVKVESINADLSILKSEADISWFSGARQRRVAKQLKRLLEGLIADGELDKQESEEWSKFFNNRKSADENILDRRVLGLRFDSSARRS